MPDPDNPRLASIASGARRGLTRFGQRLRQVRSDVQRAAPMLAFDIRNAPGRPANRDRNNARLMTMAATRNLDDVVGPSLDLPAEEQASIISLGSGFPSSSFSDNRARFGQATDTELIAEAMRTQEREQVREERGKPRSSAGTIMDSRDLALQRELRSRRAQRDTRR